MDIASTLAAYRAGRTTPAVALAAALERAGSPAARHVLTRRYDAPAQQSAQSPDTGALAGIIVTIKDLFDVAGEVTLAGSTVLAGGAPAQADAPVVARLRAAGAVILGKTNMTEFAYSGLGLNPHYGTSSNALTAGAIPGGSSAGAGVAVALGIGHASIGTDTGGSVRIPAALNGVVGFKPTARRVPLAGTVPLSASLDSIGPLARSVADCIAIDAVIADAPLHVQPANPRALRLLAPDNVVLEGMDRGVANAYSAALKRLEAAGVSIVHATMPILDELASMQAQAGIVSAQSHAWHAHLLATRRTQYDPRVAVRIDRGASVPASDYIRMLWARQRWIDQWALAIQGFDAVLMPTVPIVAPPIASLADDAEFACVNALMLRNTALINFLDGCSISLPCLSDGPGVGLMLASPGMCDAQLLGAALVLESPVGGS